MSLAPGKARNAGIVHLPRLKRARQAIAKIERDPIPMRLAAVASDLGGARAARPLAQENPHRGAEHWPRSFTDQARPERATIEREIHRQRRILARQIAGGTRSCLMHDRSRLQGRIPPFRIGRRRGRFGATPGAQLGAHARCEARRSAERIRARRRSLATYPQKLAARAEQPRPRPCFRNTRSSLARAQQFALDANRRRVF
jgi:hypothetical protein